MQISRITIEPGKMEGQPCIRGMRITVHTIVRMIRGGMTADEVLDDYPDLEPDDIAEALRYEAEISRPSTQRPK